ncbi:hypothetical protein ACFYVL_08385 [Streptomyces sp. NPDC004111]|uniref:hypothetical protein n=1 Tax=Streptomyces sp. NPDC004111 TaxID=3364690 RepID=UPI0036A5FEA6
MFGTVTSPRRRRGAVTLLAALTLCAGSLLTGTAQASPAEPTCRPDVFIDFEVTNAIAGTNAANIELTVMRCTDAGGALVNGTTTRLRAESTTWGNILYGADIETEGTPVALEATPNQYRLRQRAEFKTCLGWITPLCYHNTITFNTTVRRAPADLAWEVSNTDETTDWDVKSVRYRYP